jgi:hypothetical protein
MALSCLVNILLTCLTAGCSCVFCFALLCSPSVLASECFFWKNIQSSRECKCCPQGPWKGIDWVRSMHVTGLAHYWHILSVRWTYSYETLDHVNQWIELKDDELQDVICFPVKIAFMVLFHCPLRPLTSSRWRTHEGLCNVTLSDRLTLSDGLTAWPSTVWGSSPIHSLFTSNLLFILYGLKY